MVRFLPDSNNTELNIRDYQNKVQIHSKHVLKNKALPNFALHHVHVKFESNLRALPWQSVYRIRLLSNASVPFQQFFEKWPFNPNLFTGFKKFCRWISWIGLELSYQTINRCLKYGWFKGFSKIHGLEVTILTRGPWATSFTWENSSNQ